MKTENDVIIDNVIEAFKAMHKDYDNVFNVFYPASGSNGFTERNQTFFFTKNFLSIYKSPISDLQSAICWQEVPFGKKGEHIDTMIYLPESKSIIYIEAKRLKNGESSLKNTKSLIKNDIIRLKVKLQDQIINRFLKKDEKPLTEYIIILSDIWEKEGKSTAKFSENWCNKNWFKKEFNQEALYLGATTTELKTDNWMSLSSKEKYHLLIAMWKK